MLISADLLGRLERLQLATRRPLAGNHGGDHRSTRHGTSLDFADYREYHQGDDFRRIDFHLLARLDVLALKLFEAEDDLEVRLLVDVSASMGNKLKMASQLCAALGFLSLVRGDCVTVHAMASSDRAPSRLHTRRFAGRNAIQPLFEHLEGLHSEGTTPFLEAASELLNRAGRSGLTVVLSDLLTPEWEAAIRRFPARGGDLAIVHILAADELDTPHTGDLDLVDSESGERVPVSMSAKTRADYRQIVERWLERVALSSRGIGASYSLVDTDADIESLLLSRWRRDGVLR